MGEGSARVALEIGADHHQVRLARLVASGMATIAGFDVESVEDLRIAVDEGCVWLIDLGDGSPLSLTFRLLAAGGIEVSGATRRGDRVGDGALGALVEQIMAASCAEHRFDVADGHASFSLVARPSTVVGGERPRSEASGG